MAHRRRIKTRRTNAGDSRACATGTRRCCTLFDKTGVSFGGGSGCSDSRQTGIERTKIPVPVEWCLLDFYSDRQSALNPSLCSSFAISPCFELLARPEVEYIFMKESHVIYRLNLGTKRRAV